ncbi:MAG TPA: hypothetical protein DIT04_01640 [Dysgonomonas sp.]|nr:hypothetical protein [Dysgonomonas sp.]
MDYGAQRFRNSFLKTTFHPIAPQTVEREWGGSVYLRYVGELHLSGRFSYELRLTQENQIQT